MTKLKLLIDHSLEDNTTRLTHFNKFLKEKSVNKNSEHIYQDVILKTLCLQGNQSHACMRRSLLISPCQCKSDSRIL